MNCSHHAIINTTPLKALYGWDPPSLLPDSLFVSKVQSVEDMLVERIDLLRDLKAHLAKTQHRMHCQANKHRRDVNFEVGDLVLLKLQPYRQHSLARPLSTKLGRRFYGPFQILERIGKVAYRLQVPPHARIHVVFHVSLLRPYISNGSLPAHLALPYRFIKGRPLSKPVAVHNTQWILVECVLQEQWLVQWSDGLITDATWEPSSELRKCFPFLQLADKLLLYPGRDDTHILMDKSNVEEKVGDVHDQVSTTSQTPSSPSPQDVCYRETPNSPRRNTRRPT